MAKVPSKGTLLQVEVSSTYQNIVQLTELSTSGAASETYDSTTLDTSGAGKEYSQTGYSEGGEVTFGGYYDPDDTYHQYITDLITTPASNNFKIVFADSTPTEMVFSGAGVSFDVNVDMADGLKFSSTVKCDQLIGYPT